MTPDVTIQPFPNYPGQPQGGYRHGYTFMGTAYSEPARDGGIPWRGRLSPIVFARAYDRTRP